MFSEGHWEENPKRGDKDCLEAFWVNFMLKIDTYCNQDRMGSCRMG